MGRNKDNTPTKTVGIRKEHRNADQKDAKKKIELFASTEEGEKKPGVGLASEVLSAQQQVGIRRRETREARDGDRALADGRAEIRRRAERADQIAESMIPATSRNCAAVCVRAPQPPLVAMNSWSKPSVEGGDAAQHAQIYAAGTTPTTGISSSPRARKGPS